MKEALGEISSAVEALALVAVLRTVFIANIYSYSTDYAKALDDIQLVQQLAARYEEAFVNINRTMRPPV